MSEPVMPKFMQDYLDELLNYPNGDDAYPEMQKLAAQYQKDHEHLTKNLGAYGPKQDVRKIHADGKERIDKLYKAEALKVAKKFGYKEPEKDKEKLSSTEKEKQFKDNFKKEEASKQNKLDQEQEKKDEKKEAIEDKKDKVKIDKEEREDDKKEDEKEQEEEKDKSEDDDKKDSEKVDNEKDEPENSDNQAEEAKKRQDAELALFMAEMKAATERSQSIRPER